VPGVPAGVALTPRRLIILEGVHGGNALHFYTLPGGELASTWVLPRTLQAPILSPDGRLLATLPGGPALVDRSAGKVKSDEPELWLRLVRAPKLIDLVRTPWGFAGVLVKFKLEVGVGEEQLLDVAERSRRHSAADLMVANTLEGADAWAYLGPINGAYERVARPELPARLVEAVVNCREAKSRG